VPSGGRVSLSKSNTWTITYSLHDQSGYTIYNTILINITHAVRVEARGSVVG
jgi:hypothetical protein